MLRPGGRVAYYVIHATPDLSRAAYDTAVALGPPFVGSRLDPVAAIRKVGFSDVVQVDVTDDFLRLCVAMRDTQLRYETKLRAELGDVPYDDACAKQERHIEGIQTGVLRRSLMVGTKSRGRG